MSPCYCSSCDMSLRLPLARLFKQRVQTELLTFAVAVTLDTSPRSTMYMYIYRKCIRRLDLPPPIHPIVHIKIRSHVSAETDNFYCLEAPGSPRHASCDTQFVTLVTLDMVISEIRHVTYVLLTGEPFQKYFSIILCITENRPCNVQ